MYNIQCLTFAYWGFVGPSSLFALSEPDTHEIVTIVAEVFGVRSNSCGAVDHDTVMWRNQLLTSRS